LIEQVCPYCLKSPLYGTRPTPSSALFRCCEDWVTPYAQHGNLVPASDLLQTGPHTERRVPSPNHTPMPGLTSRRVLAFPYGVHLPLSHSRTKHQLPSTTEGSQEASERGWGWGGEWDKEHGQVTGTRSFPDTLMQSDPMYKQMLL
jgi:hypothetical protein